MVNPDIGLKESGDPQGLTYSRPIECGSRQPIQAMQNHPNRVVSPSRGFPVDMHQVAPTSDRFICNEAQQVTSVCVTSSRLPSLGSGCTQSTFGGSGPICLPTSSYSVQGGGET